MAIIYATNFAELMGNAAVHTVSALGRDAALTPAGLALLLPGEQSVGCDLGNASSAGELWLSGRFHTPLSASVGLTFPVLRVIAGWTEFRFEHTSINNNTLRANIINAGNTAGASWTYAASVTYEIVIRCRFSGGSAIVECYVGGSLVSTATRTATAANFTQGSWGNGMGVRATDGANTVYVNEIIAADEDIRGRRVATLTANAAGNYGEWIGSGAALGDFDALSGMQALNAGQRQSRIHAAAPAGTIRAIIPQTRYLVSPSAARLSHLVRIGGVDYYGGIKTPGQAAPSNVAATVFDLNPATGLPWTTADLAALDAGFRAELP